MSQLPICCCSWQGLERQGLSARLQGPGLSLQFRDRPLGLPAGSGALPRPPESGHRFLAGQIQPPNLMGALKYMGLAPGEIGDDAHKYAWVEAYRNRPQAKRAA